MTVTHLRTRIRSTAERTVESARVADLQEMIRSGRYDGFLDELLNELDKAKAARAEIRDLTATSVLAA